MTDYLEHVVECPSCGERYCSKCDTHWAECPCPGPHDDEGLPDFTRAELDENLEQFEVKTADGFEDALIGMVSRFGMETPVALYDRRKCLQILMERDGMDYEGAVEFFDFNVIGAWVGEGTPAFADLISPPSRPPA
jgi:hypothetical protein